MSGMAEIYLSGFRDLQKPIQRDVIKQLLKEPGIAGAVDTSTLLDILKVKLEDSTPRRDAETSVEQNRAPGRFDMTNPGQQLGQSATIRPLSLNFQTAYSQTAPSPMASNTLGCRETWSKMSWDLR